MPRLPLESSTVALSLLGALALAGVVACSSDAADASHDSPPAAGEGPGDGTPLPPAADGGVALDGALSDGATSDGAPIIGSSYPPGFSLVTDLDTKGAGSSPEPLAVVNGALLFAATDEAHGRELFRTDGTQAGTSLVSDLRPGPLSSNPVIFANLGTRVVVGVETGQAGMQLWVTDGTTAGTTKIFDGYVCAPRRAAVVGSSFYFCASSATAGGGTTKLWQSDGTASGTVIAANVAAAGPIVSLGGVLYFSAYASGTRNLYRYDGASNGAVVTTAVRNIDALTVLGSKLFFFGSDTSGGPEPWISDGTEAGTLRLADITPGATGSWGGVPPVILGGQAFFVATQPTTGTELWKTDGTSAGTAVVKDIFPGTPSSFPTSLRAIGSKLYFAADDGFKGREPWVSDGTAAGTKRIADVRVGADGAGVTGPREFTAVGSTVYFSASDGTHGYELWKTDGTEAGTSMVVDTFTGDADAYPDHLFAFGSSLAYACADDTTAAELCFSDGTAAGTGVRVRAASGTGDGVLGSVVAGGATSPLFFAGRATHARSTLSDPYGLWASDGTAAGTVSLTTTKATVLTGVSDPVIVGGVAYFRARTEKEGVELWRSDGTAAGTKLVRDIAPGTQNGVDLRAPLVDVAGTLYFVGSDGSHGRELWKSDGTEVGTVMVGDIGFGDSINEGIVGASDGVYFVSRSFSAPGVYRGDANGLHLLQSANNAYAVTVGANHPFWFQGSAVYTSDGSAANVAKVFDIPSTSMAVALAGTSSGAVFTLRQPSQHAGEIWSTDGTAAGTARLASFVPAVNDPFCGLSSLSDGVVGNVVYFCADDGAHGAELWKTDLTAAGTALVKDVQAGAGSGKPIAISSALGRVYFGADDGVHGVELWSTDGTDTGTRLVGDLAPGAASSSPSRVTARASTVFFGATGPNVGRELWALDPTLVTP